MTKNDVGVVFIKFYHKQEPLALINQTNWMPFWEYYHDLLKY